MVNRKVLFGILAAMMFVGMAGAGTWAYFSSTEASVNDVSAGNIKMWIDGADSQSVVNGNTITGAYPGQENIKIKDLQLGNSGTVPGKLTCHITDADLYENGANIGSALIIKLGDKEIWHAGTTGEIDLGSLNPSQIWGQPLTYTFYESHKDQNTFQNQNFKFNIVFTLKQEGA